MPNMGMMQMGVGGFAPDGEPDAYTFTDVTGQSTSTVVTSNTITVLDINITAPISITGGTYSINGGGYTASAGTVTKDDTIAVRVTSSSSFNTVVSCTTTIGGISDTFSVTTKVAASFTWLGHNKSTTNGFSYSWSGQSFGSASATRRLVACVIASGASPGTAFNSVTIGGVAATYHYKQSSYYNESLVGIYSAAVPSGTSGTVAFVTNGGNAYNAGFGLFSLLNAAASPTSATGGMTQTAGTPSASVTIPAGGVGFGSVYHGSSAGGPWGGLTRIFQSSPIETTERHEFAALASNTIRSGLSVSFVAPSVSALTAVTFGPS